MAARRKRGIIARLISLIFKLVVGFMLISLLLVVIFRFVPPPVTITMLLDQNGSTRDWTPLAQINRNMVSAAVAAEDGKFCSHSGFDRDAIEDALRRNAQGGRIRGGSTISQQTAKNVFLWQGGGFFRKGLEAWFTVLIETIWGKRRIMEVYLNVAETGIGTYGVEAGAQRYYKTPAASLTRDQAARIAAALPLPKQRAVTNPSGFTRRYGNSIASRIRVVQNEGLDACARP
ncbi:monofunctional biosynthetic peptidoglycan transglycosylase [Blastomonas sp.]|uniref:monofunctional biosynthetic peptidoglycan transglycosylase n=1 Tax=Blastomonas sp. TaxID=1909299 RepID=UPI003592F60F